VSRVGNGPVVPDFRTRNDLIADGLRPERGIASLGELALLTVEPVTQPPGFNVNRYKRSWRVDMAGNNPFDIVSGTPLISSRASIDVVDGNDPATNVLGPDKVAQDAEEEHLLLSGLSNVLSTRSDVFTVYFRIRSFKQNPVTGTWDATNPEMIVDDSRYVMLVDRAEVDHPNEKPTIVYLEKLPK
jgi:hypothetical protein